MMTARHRRIASRLTVGSLCAAVLLCAPAAAWSQEPPSSGRPQRLRLDVGAPNLELGAPHAGARGRAAAGINRSWADLAASARVGRKVNVALADSSRVEGRLLAIDAGSITVEQQGRPRVVAARDILSVRYADVRKRHVLRGILVGMATGAVATWAIDRQSSQPSSAAEALGIGAVFLGLPLGAVVGAAFPAGPPLYEAPRTVGNGR